MESIMLVTNGMGLNKRQSNNTEGGACFLLASLRFPSIWILGHPVFGTEQLQKGDDEGTIVCCYFDAKPPKEEVEVELGSAVINV